MLRVHCLNDVLPQHTSLEIEALKQDLKANGLKVPVIVDETGEIIDGRLRADLCDKLSLPWRPTAMTEAGLTADQKAALRIKLNFLRRNTPPNAKQKRKFLEVILKAETHLSNGAIAQLCGLDDSTVSKKRKKLVNAGEVSAASVVTGVDGVPRWKPQLTKPTSIPEGAPSIKLATVDDCSTADDAATPVPVGCLESSTVSLKLVEAFLAEDGQWAWLAQDEQGNNYIVTCRRVEAATHPGQQMLEHLAG